MRTMSFIAAAAVCLAAAAVSITGGCATTATGTGEVAAGDPFESAVRSGSLEAAQERAADDGRLLLVVGTADWCGPCRRMKADTWSDPQVQAWVEDNALLYYLDIDQHTEIARTLGITSIPQIVAFRNDAEVDRVTGYRDAEAFLSWLNALPEDQVARR